MALTKLDLVTMIEDDIDEVVVRSAIQCINAAGQYLMTMYPWSWARQALASLSLTASQAYVELPSNFVAMDDVQPADQSEWIQFVTRSEFLHWQRNQATPSGYLGYCGSVVDPTTNALTQVIHLYPTPATNETDAFTIAYRSGWSSFASSDADEKRIPIPEWLEPLFLEVFRAYYMGLEEEGNGGVTQRLALVESGSVFETAIVTDQSAQPYMSESGHTPRRVSDSTYYDSDLEP